MFRNDEAKAFIEKLHKNNKERINKLENNKSKERIKIQEEIINRKEIAEEAKRRKKLENQSIGILNKDFIKFQQYKRYQQYNKSLPPIVKKKIEKRLEREEYEDSKKERADNHNLYNHNYYNHRTDNYVENYKSSDAIVQPDKNKKNYQIEINEIYENRDKIINEIKNKYLN